MLSYKLAKELKDAGWKQNNKFCAYCHTEQRHFYKAEDGTTTEVVKPSLEELIEACGDKFEVLRNYNKGWIAVGNSKGVSEGEAPDTHSAPLNEGIEVLDKTPTEAVARLYLKLNEKKDGSEEGI
jgi:hypothetical protein